MTPQEADEVRRLTRILITRSIRAFAVSRGVADPSETQISTQQAKVKAAQALDDYLETFTGKPV